MKYKVIVKHIEVMEVSARNEDEAIYTIEQMIKQNDPRALLEIQVAEEQE